MKILLTVAGETLMPCHQVRARRRAARAGSNGSKTGPATRFLETHAGAARPTCLRCAAIEHLLAVC